MNYIFGLGNPGRDHQRTRHNTGFMVVDRLAGKDINWQRNKGSQSLYLPKLFGNQDSLLVKPQTFMNESGSCVAHTLRQKHLADYHQVYVVHDDLDLALGEYKVQFGRGPHIHNGLLSIYQYLKTKEFWHVRVGVDGRNGDRSIPGDRYVLMPFKAEEIPQFKQVLALVVDELSLRLSLPIQ